jgi:TonB family protein
MKKHLFTFLLIGASFGQKEYNVNDIIKQNEIWIKKFSDEKVNGKVYFDIEGNKIVLGLMSDGKKNGKWSYWYDSGIKKRDEYFDYGKSVGDWTYYNSKGVLVATQIFSALDNYSTMISFDSNGKEITEGVIKDGNRYDGKFADYRGAGTYEIEGHAIYENSKLLIVYYFDENGDTSSIGKLVNGRLNLSPFKIDESKIKLGTKESSEKDVFIPYDVTPSPKRAIRPYYPEEAKKAGISGMVVVQAYINAKGKVTETIILKGIPGLNEAAMNAIRKTRFRPAKQKGKKVGIWISIPVNFRL